MNRIVASADIATVSNIFELQQILETNIHSKMNTTNSKQYSSSSGHPSGTTDKPTSDKKNNSDSTKKASKSSASSIKFYKTVLVKSMKDLLFRSLKMSYSILGKFVYYSSTTTSVLYR